jgi:hypothetical protein
MHVYTHVDLIQQQDELTKEQIVKTHALRYAACSKREPSKGDTRRMYELKNDLDWSVDGRSVLPLFQL